VSEGLHVTHGLKLGPKIGPLPAGVWVAVLVAGVYVGHRRSQSAAASAAATPADPTTAAADMADTSSSADLSSAGDGSLLPTGLPDGSGDYTAGDGTTSGGPIVIVLPAPPTPTGTAGGTTTVHVPTKVIPSRPRATGSPKPGPRPVHRPAPAAPKATSYTVHAGDTLSSIGGRLHVDWHALYTVNRTAIENAAKSHGKASSEGGHWIYPGTVLRVP
jgi:nucleoid-associated protein YgaU